MRTIDTNKTKHNIAEVPFEKRTISITKYSYGVLEAAEEPDKGEDYLDARTYAYAHGFKEEDY